MLDYQRLGYLYIISNEFQMNLIGSSEITKHLDLYINQIQGREYMKFQPKTAFQTAQLMFNLYPEMLNHSAIDSNPFKEFYEKLLRSYEVSRMIIDRKQKGLQLEYTETNHYSQFIFKKDLVIRQNAKFEQNIAELLDELGYKYTREKKLLIYEVDF